MKTKTFRANGFYKIDKVIKQTAKQHNLEGALYRHQALTCWNEIAKGFLAESKELTKAVDLKKGVLTVACLTREVAYKIKLFAPRIIEALNQVLGRRVVFAIYTEA